jgi:L-threonylcarbamoyladenylate synthase
MKKFNFDKRVLDVVSKIKKGKFKTYKEVAELAGNKKAARAVGNILAKNKNSKIPCHRVIKNDGLVGGYFGKENLCWKKFALLLKEGVAAVMPTDTIYGICGSALNEKTVEKIYKLRKRAPQKPMIILISGFNDLNIFGIKPNKKERDVLEKIWPGKVSVILNIKNKEKIKKFEYLHRRTKTLSFRLPKSGFLSKILKISGPLVAPSANWESHIPAKTINEAKKYFGNKVVYYDKGKIVGKPSTLIKIKDGKIEVLRKGANYKKI